MVPHSLVYRLARVLLYLGFLLLMLYVILYQLSILCPFLGVEIGHINLLVGWKLAKSINYVVLEFFQVWRVCQLVQKVILVFIYSIRFDPYRTLASNPFGKQEVYLNLLLVGGEITLDLHELQILYVWELLKGVLYSICWTYYYFDSDGIWLLKWIIKILYFYLIGVVVRGYQHVRTIDEAGNEGLQNPE